MAPCPYANGEIHASLRVHSLRIHGEPTPGVTALRAGDTLVRHVSLPPPRGNFGNLSLP